MNNPYKILGISRSANLNIARNKYIKLSKQFHPDVSKYNLEVSENKMKEVNSAYSLIKNSIARGVIAYRPRGRFTKEEIDELIQRFNEGQSLYKIGRDMKRKQRSVKRHLINAGLMEEEIFYDTYTKNINLDLDWSYNKFFFKTFLIACISFIMLIEPRLNLLEMWIYGLIDIF
jgi:curved DNA-binding protein CbpA